MLGDNLKRKTNLYQNLYQFENILDAYQEICRNTKNKKKVEAFKQYKCFAITHAYTTLKNRTYHPGPCHTFTILEPKKRIVVSQTMQDKLINHLVARHILYPALLPCLLDVNVASRKGLGTSEGVRLMLKFHRTCKIKYKEYYILKCDISKFFASIDHRILKEKLKRKIKDKDALKIVFDIIDSEENGLSIGFMTSQILAIFYLNDMDHFIKEVLNIKYYVRYQDDFLLFHPSKQYLQYCLAELKKFLEKENLKLNQKTRIYKNSNNFIFLRRKKNGNYAKHRDIKRKIKQKVYFYHTKKIDLFSLTNSIICYKNLLKK